MSQIVTEINDKTYIWNFFYTELFSFTELGFSLSAQKS